jgi:hypothetical protein
MDFLPFDLFDLGGYKIFLAIFPRLPVKLIQHNASPIEKSFVDLSHFCPENDIVVLLNSRNPSKSDRIGKTRPSILVLIEETE